MFVAVCWILLVIGGDCFSLCVPLGSSGTSQSPAVVHLTAEMIVLPRYDTLQLISFRWTSQPALYNVTMEMSENPSTPGTMWANLAFVGRLGILRLHV